MLVNAREAVSWIFLIDLVIGIIAIAAIPQDYWKYIADWQKALFAFQILLGICGVLIGFWVSGDADEIRSLQVRIRRLEDLQNQLNMERHKEEKRQREEKKKG
jgi:hypothetical protein